MCYLVTWQLKSAILHSGFPGGSVVKNSPAKQETQLRSLSQEDPHGIGNGNPPQYSCLGNPMEKESCGLQDLAIKQQFFIQQYSFIVSNWLHKWYCFVCNNIDSSTLRCYCFSEEEHLSTDCKNHANSQPPR